MSDMQYDGQTLTWASFGSFKATSGMPGHQSPSEQCTSDAGPVPEGKYQLYLSVGADAKDNGTNSCNLAPSWQVQTIPRGPQAGDCEPFWRNWGNNRVRIEAIDGATRSACAEKGVRRSGFYLHDSTKGYSHGCIEVERRFFELLRGYIKTNKVKKKYLYLTVKYTTQTTNGGTGP